MKTLHLKYKLRLLLFLPYVFIFIFFQFEPVKLFISLVLYWLLMAIQCIGLHRYFSHKSFTTSRFFEVVFILASIPIGQGSPMNWAANHRTHHRHSDVPGDPHSPQLKPWWSVIFGFGEVVKISPFVIREFLADRLQGFVHSYYFILFLGYSSLFLLLTGPQGLIYFVLIPMLLLNHVTGYINYACHKFGYRSHETSDRSYNNPIIFFLTLGGEGWHNNHHADPKNPRHGFKWYEFDPYAFIIEKWLAITR